MITFDYMQYSEIVDSSFTHVDLPKNIFDKYYRKISFLKYKLNRKYAVRDSYGYLKQRYPFMVTIQDKARENGGLAGDYQWLRLAEIARIFKTHSPLTVCELGGGTSSAMFASILSDAVRFVTVEESGYWQTRMLDLVGDFSRYMTCVRADRMVDSRNGESVTYYDIDHTKNYDLVYVDGPSAQPLEHDRGLNIKDPDGLMPNIDVELFWENGQYPRIILIDGRRPTVRRLLQKSKGRYHVFLKSDLLAKVGLPSFSGFLYHTLMIYNDKNF